MSDNTSSDQDIQSQDETIATADVVTQPETYTAEYVKALRDEAANYRVKAKRVTDANARLTSAFVAQDGRLVDPDVFTFTDDLMDDDGLVSHDKVSAAISALITDKPYLLRRTPSTSIAQGMRQSAPDEINWLTVLRPSSRAQ